MPVTATFDENNITYETDFIEVPVTASEAVLSLHATDFTLKKVNGDAVYDFETALIRTTATGTGYKLRIFVPKALRGVFSLSLDSNIIRRSNGADDNIRTAAPIAIAYDTRIPSIADVAMPGQVAPGLWDVYLDFGMDITGLAPTDFETAGAALPTPTIYRWTGTDTDPDIHAATDHASKADDDAFQTGQPKTKANLASSVGHWTQTADTGNTTEARFFLLRYLNPNALPPEMLGSYNLILQENAVRGPTGQGTAVSVTFPPEAERAINFTADTAFSQTWTLYGTGVTGRAVTNLPNGVTATWQPSTLTGNSSVHQLTIAGTTSAAFTARVTLTTAAGTFSVTFPFTTGAGASVGASAQASARGQATPVIGTPTVDPTTMTLNTAFETFIPISNAPAYVTVDGLLKEEFAYDWQSGQNRVRIHGTPATFQQGTWFISAYETALTDTPVVKEVTWGVISDDIAIQTIAALKLPRNVPINFVVPITNHPTAVSVSGLQIGLQANATEGTPPGTAVTGEIPSGDNFTKTTDGFIIRASGHTDQNYTENGETLIGVKGTQSYEILSGAVGTPSPLTAETEGKKTVLSFPDVPNAIGYQYRLAEQDLWTDFFTETVIDPNTVTLTRGHLDVTVSFPTLTGATAYQYALEKAQAASGPWLDFPAAVNNMVTKIIPNLEEGIAYKVHLRVNQPWIGEPITLTFIPGRTAYAISGSGSSAALYIFNTGTPNNTVAETVKKILLPTSVTSPTGIAISGTYAYVTNRDSPAKIYVFPLSTADGQRATASRTFTLAENTGTGKDIDIVGTTLYFGTPSGGIKTYSKDTADGAQAAVINAYSYSTGSANFTHIAIDDSIVYAIHKSTNTYLTLYNIAGGSAIKSFQLDSDNNDAKGIAYRDNKIYIGDYNDDLLYIYPDDVASGETAAPLKTFSLPLGCDDIRGLWVA